jgi:hypothetical protein
MAKSTILSHFLGILGIFREGKVSADEKYGKIYLIDIFCTHQVNTFRLVKLFLKCIVWEIGYLAKNSKSGKKW